MTEEKVHVAPCNGGVFSDPICGTNGQHAVWNGDRIFFTAIDADEGSLDDINSEEVIEEYKVCKECVPEPDYKKICRWGSAYTEKYMDAYQSSNKSSDPL